MPSVFRALTDCRRGERRRVDLHARTVRRRDRDRPHVRALGRRRLELHQRVEQRAEVLRERLGLERRLAERRLDDARLLDAELDATGLELATALVTSAVTVPNTNSTNE